jgi:aryl-alcohol dehydrogenase-like predicted oxidoreductase
MTLPRRELGRTGMEISAVGLGAWAIGGAGWAFGWGDQDDGESVAAIRHAVESGVNWIDTAAVYGLGHSEEVVARALADIPADERPYVFTKCGLVWDPADHSAEPRKVMAPDSVRRELEDSLRRLRVDRIDLYQVHWPPQDGTSVEEAWGTLVDLRREGKVRAIGLSNHSVEQLEAAEAIGHVDALQPPFSAIRRSAAAELAWCDANGTGAIVYSPLQSGLLSGAFSADRVRWLPTDDWRRDDPEFTTQGKANFALADALATLGRRRGVTAAAVAIAWTLAWPGVTGAIVGARRADQVDGWIGGGTLSLTEDELDEIAAAITGTRAGAGPRRPPLSRAGGPLRS